MDLPDVLETAVGDYVKWAERYISSVEKKNAVKKPLYHYTDATGLKGVIENDEIWFTDFRYLNDPSELRHGISRPRSDYQGSSQRKGSEHPLPNNRRFIFCLKF